MIKPRLDTWDAVALFTVLGFVLGFGLGGCSQHSASPLIGPAEGADWPVLREISDVESTYRRPLRVTIYDRALLAELSLVRLDVDFDSEMVLLAAMGPASDPGCRIRIERVWREGDRMRVRVSNVYPKKSGTRRIATISPFHAVVVPRCTLPFARFSSLLPPNSVSSDKVGR